MRVVIEGVGKDAEIITNEAGGKQSEAPAALHLIDPTYLTIFFRSWASDSIEIRKAGANMALYMKSKDVKLLYDAIKYLESDDIQSLMIIGKVLQYGVTHGNNGKGYPVGNWRLISREEHINHALIHLVSLLAGDTQDDHKEHAMCRLMMAISTMESINFSYTEAVS